MKAIVMAFLLVLAYGDNWAYMPCTDSECAGEIEAEIYGVCQ